MTKVLNDIILTGPPRSGTTLACYLLNKVRDTVALHEPMNLHMFPDRAAGIRAVRDFFPEMRKSLLETGQAVSKASGGLIPANPFGTSGDNGRESIVRKGLVQFDKNLGPDFKLIIKHNGHFTFLLPELEEYFPVYIIIRHPVATIASWNSVNAPVAGGNLKVLKTLDPDLYRFLEAEPDLITRQVMLLDLMYKAYVSTKRAGFIRYEDMTASGGNVLGSIVPEASRLNESLENKNKNPLYEPALINEIKSRLVDLKGSYLEFYPKDIIEDY